MAVKKWLKNPSQFGQCRSFQHSWPKLGKRKGWLVVEGNAYIARLQCTICTVVRVSRINRYTGKMQSHYEYPKGYLLERTNPKQKLPSKGELRKEFIEWITK